MNSIKTEIAEIVAQLNHLLTRNIDAEKGYAEAIEKVKNPELKSFMVSQAKQRANFSDELKETVRSLGGTPKANTSFDSNIHRVWMDVRAIIAQSINPDQMDQIIRDECKRGEKAAVKEYTRVLEETNFAPPARKLLQQQKDRITASHQFLEHFQP